jgi:hypothetical protein
MKKRRAHKALKDDETHFIIVDLDIFSKRRLASLVEAMGRKVLVLHEGRWGSRYSANVELGNSWNQSADQEIRRLISLVRGLPSPARRIWNAAQAREFNVGIQAAQDSRTFELRLPPKTLEAVASIGGRIVITVYAPERLRTLPTRRTRKQKAAQ